MFKFLKKTKYINVALPLLVFLLLLGILFFVLNSLEIVSDTNKNNFAYTLKINKALEEIDKIVERAEVNVSVLSDTITASYDISKIDDEKYNMNYLQTIGVLTKAVLINSPGVSGSWVQLRVDTPFSNNTFKWYEFKNGKIIDLKKQLDKTNPKGRKVNPDCDPYYFQALRAKKTVWSNVYNDIETNTKMMTIAQPIYKNNVLIGVAGVDISVKDLKKALKKMQSVFKGSEIFLLDTNKNVVTYQLLNNKKIREHDFKYLDLFRDKSPNEKAIIECLDNGIKRTAIMLSLSNKYFIVMTFQNMIIYKGFNRLFNTIYFILAILAILAIAVLCYKEKMIKINAKLENEKNTLRTIIDSSPSFILVKNLDGVYTECNNKFLELKGLKREDFIGKTDYDLFEKDEVEEILKNDNIVKETKKTLIKEACYFNRKEENFYIEKYVIPLLDSDDNVIGLCVICFDITKKHQAQEHLEQAKEAAEKANMMKSSFLANMSHEIRTPLNGVLGFLQLLEDTNPTEEQKEFIADAQVSSELLILIINEILDFSKIEAGKLKTEVISFDVRSIVEDVTIINTSEACKKGLDINSLICSDVPQKVFGDPGRVKQILNNLVSNAIKFTQYGDVVIYVNQVSGDDDNIVLSFRVKDTGIGISNDKLKLIFESFSQADTSTTRKYGGTGLGLAISQKLTELMNGQISVESNLNEGSTFVLTLPFKVDKNPSKNVDNSINTLSGANVLILDDFCTDLKIIRYYLNEVNCNIKEARSLEEALDIINKGKMVISAILIDYKMQNSGKIELSQALKSNEKSKDIPLILYTAMGLSGDGIEAREEGFAGYLTKPLKKRELIDSLAAAINDKNKNIPTSFVTKHNMKEKKFDAKTKILVVDDVELNCKFTLKLLSRVGLSCDIATEGKTAIEAFKSKKYDLILMDCLMPVMDGYEATKEIRKIEGTTSHIPIIAMTAKAMKSDKNQCYDAGMDDYICKPMKAEELLSLISKYVKLKNDSYIGTIIEELISEVGFTKSEAVQLFNEFLEFLPKSILEIETLLEENNFEALKNIAHKLKGASANLRIEKISQSSAQLEIACLNCDKAFCIDITEQIKTHLEYLNMMNKQEDFVTT